MLESSSASSPDSVVSKNNEDKPFPEDPSTFSFDQFEILRVLRDTDHNGDMALLARLKKDRIVAIEDKTGNESETSSTNITTEAAQNDVPIVMVLRPKGISFSSEDLPVIMDRATPVKFDLNNTVYYYYTIKPPGLPELWMQVVYPTKESEVVLYEAQKMYHIRESPSDYQELFLPLIRAIPSSRNAWIDKIINREATNDVEVMYEDEDFVFVRDAKWNGVDPRKLHCLAILKDKSLYTMRELKQSHVSMLKKIKEVGLGQIERRYGLPGHQIKAFLHYLPSFFQLHIHFCSLHTDAKESNVERAHLLDDIIDSLDTVNDNDRKEYYERVSVSISVGEHSPFFKAYNEKYNIQS